MTEWLTARAVEKAYLSAGQVRCVLWGFQVESVSWLTQKATFSICAFVVVVVVK